MTIILATIELELEIIKGTNLLVSKFILLWHLIKGLIMPFLNSNWIVLIFCSCKGDICSCIRFNLSLITLSSLLLLLYLLSRWPRFPYTSDNGVLPFILCQFWSCYLDSCFFSFNILVDEGIELFFFNSFFMELFCFHDPSKKYGKLI